MKFGRKQTTAWAQGYRIVGGQRHFFRSSWDANFARYLQWKKDHKQIHDWEYEPETFWFDGVKRGCVSYKPDFRVTEMDFSQYRVEVKGWMDAKSATKIKRMKKYHPEIVLVIMSAAEFRKLARDLAPLIPDWEGA